MKAFLTGGAGFIGTHLTELLLESGCSVSCLDDLSTGSRENAQRFAADSRYAFKLGRVETDESLEAMIQEADVVFHLAATVGVKNVVRDPIRTIENNVRGTSRVLELADAHDKRLFVFSTSEVYGKSEKFPFNEDNDLVLGCSKKPRWSYACSKLLDEFLARAYFLQHGTRVTTIRLFNTIGCGQVSHYGMVVPTFFKQALAGERITVFGSGQQTRCFTDVRDVVQSLQALIPVEASYGDVVNIGGAQEISIVDLARTVAELTGSTSTIEFVPFDKVYGADFEDMRRRVPCCARLTALTGRAFKYRLADTLNWIHAALAEEIGAPSGPVVPQVLAGNL